MPPTALYADHNATAPLRPVAREAMLRALDVGGNPSSVHGAGRAARRLLEDARETLAALTGSQPDLLTFTSGATEALHLAMESAKAAGFGAGGRVFVGAGEHDAVWSFARQLWPDLRVIPVDRQIEPDVDWLARALADSAGAGAGPPLVILQAVNNETGTIMPVGPVSTLVRAAGGALVCDAVQAAGKTGWAAVQGYGDWTVISSHKLGGPPGAGLLASAPGIPVINQRPGGGQERGARAGTPNVAAMCGFAAAAAEGMPDEAVRQWSQRTGAARDAYERALCQSCPDAVVIAATVTRVANTSCVALPGWEAARQVMALDLEGAAVSAGAACSSGKVRSSRVLEAGGHPPEIASCAIRASFGWNSLAGEGARLAQLHVAAARRAHRLAA
jgi:cysteine desulfurase